MVVGVTDGFRKELEIVGVGYRATAQGTDKLELALGFSHPVKVDAPDGHHLRGARRPPASSSSGIDKELVGQVAANIRTIRKPEPYKGKGVRYLGEHVVRKAGKTGEVGRRMSDSAKQKRDARIRRHRRVRKKVAGTAERPRLAVFRSNKHISAQVIDDRAGSHARRGVDRRGRPRAPAPRATATPPPRSASSSPSGPRPPASQGRVRPRRLPLPRPGRRRGRRRPRSRTGVLMALT